MRAILIMYTYFSKAIYHTDITNETFSLKNSISSLKSHGDLLLQDFY
jgi:hypothetical protein